MLNPFRTSTGIFCGRYSLESLVYRVVETTLNWHTTTIPKNCLSAFLYSGAVREKYSEAGRASAPQTQQWQEITLLVLGAINIGAEIQFIIFHCVRNILKMNNHFTGWNVMVMH